MSDALLAWTCSEFEFQSALLTTTHRPGARASKQARMRVTATSTTLVSYCACRGEEKNICRLCRRRSDGQNYSRLARRWNRTAEHRPTEYDTRRGVDLPCHGLSQSLTPPCPEQTSSLSRNVVLGARHQCLAGKVRKPHCRPQESGLNVCRLYSIHAALDGELKSFAR